MKKILAVLILTVFVVPVANAKEIRVSVKGMVCGFCAAGIEKKFKAEASVEKVHVSLEKKLVTIDLKKDQDLADKSIEKIITDAGYNIEKIER